MRPTGDHWPSPATGGLANGSDGRRHRAGAAPSRRRAVCRNHSSACEWSQRRGYRRPSAGDGSTTRSPPRRRWTAPPWPRNHSAARAPMELPRAGLARAPPSEMASQRKRKQKKAAMAAMMRRRRRWRGDLDQRQAGRVRRRSESLSSSASVGLNALAPSGAGPAWPAANRSSLRRGRERVERGDAQGPDCGDVVRQAVQRTGIAQASRMALLLRARLSNLRHADNGKDEP